MAVTKEQIKAKQKLLFTEAENLEQKINQLVKDEQVKNDLLFSVAQIKDIALSYAEVLRLADVIWKITKDSEKDLFFKTLLKKNLYKIYLGQEQER